MVRFVGPEEDDLAEWRARVDLEVAAMDWLARPRGERVRNWDQRERYLHKHPTWQQRRRLAHDLRNGEPFHVPMDIAVDVKRRYQWAENSFESGYLSPQDFLREATRFDQAVRIFRANGHRTDRQLVTLEQMARERSRLRKESASVFVDLEAWRRLASAMKEYRERERAWQQARAARAETARQRKALREGHQTLLAIKRLLRGAVQSPHLASAQARTSPTS